jgi:hypothetical protein
MKTPPNADAIGHGSKYAKYAVMSQSAVAKAMGLTKRQVQLSEARAMDKIRAGFDGWFNQTAKGDGAL